MLHYYNVSPFYVDTPYNVKNAIDGQYFFPNNATLPLDRCSENLMIIFDDCSFIFHYVVEFDTRDTI